MKRALPLIVLFVAAALLWPVVAAAMSTVPLHHFYQPKFDFHFYTISDSDVAIVKADPNWRYLGIAAHVLPESAPQTAVLFRLRKDEFGGVNHLYTVSMEEANHAIDTAGWREEGFAGHIATKQVPGTVPLYRLYKPCVLPDDGKFRDAAACQDATGGDVHIYTTVETDKNSALAHGYQLVRVEGYVWPAPATYPPVPKLKVTPTGPAVPHITAKPGDGSQMQLNLRLVNRRNSAGAVDYDLEIANADAVPADWFKPLTILAPEGCWRGPASSARLFLEIAWGPGTDPNRRGQCRPVSSRAELAKFTYSLAQEKGNAGSLRVVLRDRLTNVRHLSNISSAAAFGASEALASAGCKPFLGRTDDFFCQSATGMAACTNLKTKGVVRECRSVTKK
jgi:hypothetical protein